MIDPTASGISLAGPVVLSKTQKEALVSDYLKTPAGRAKLAASMSQPLRGKMRMPVNCPACGKLTHDLSAHAGGFDDDAHTIVLIHGS